MQIWTKVGFVLGAWREGLLGVGLGEGWVCTMAMGTDPYETIAAPVSVD